MKIIGKFLAIALFTFLVGCKKETNTSDNNYLVGKWIMESSSIKAISNDNGGTVRESIAMPRHLIEFTEEGSFITRASNSSGFDSIVYSYVAANKELKIVDIESITMYALSDVFRNDSIHSYVFNVQVEDEDKCKLQTEFDEAGAYIGDDFVGDVNLNITWTLVSTDVEWQ